MSEGKVMVDHEMLKWLVDCTKLLGRRFRTGEKYDERIKKADRLLAAASQEEQ